MKYIIIEPLNWFQSIVIVHDRHKIKGTGPQSLSMVMFVADVNNYVINGPDPVLASVVTLHTSPGCLRSDDAVLVVALALEH